jgi:hypothetical protein
MRQTRRLEGNGRVLMETLVLFMRFSLSMTPLLPPDALAAAQAKAVNGMKGSSKPWGQRLKNGQSFLNEIPDDVEPSFGERNNGSEGA